MNAWAAKIDGDDYDDLTLAKQLEAPTIDLIYSEQKAGSSLSHQQQALSANSHQQKGAIKSNQQKQISTNSQQQKVSSTSHQRQKGSSEISVVKQKMVFTEVVPKFVTHKEESSSSDSESDTESFKAEVIIKAKKQRELWRCSVRKLSRLQPVGRGSFKL